MWTRMGIWCLLGAFFFWVFSGISAFMKVDNFWRGLTLSRLLGDYTDVVVYTVPWQPVEVFMYFFVVELPLYGVLLGMGTLFLTINVVVNVR